LPQANGGKTLIKKAVACPLKRGELVVSKLPIPRFPLSIAPNRQGQGDLPARGWQATYPGQKGRNQAGQSPHIKASFTLPDLLGPVKVLEAGGKIPESVAKQDLVRRPGHEGWGSTRGLSVPHRFAPVHGKTGRVLEPKHQIPLMGWGLDWVFRREIDREREQARRVGRCGANGSLVGQPLVAGGKPRAIGKQESPLSNQISRFLPLAGLLGHTNETTQSLRMLGTGDHQFSLVVHRFFDFLLPEENPHNRPDGGDMIGPQFEGLLEAFQCRFQKLPPLFFHGKGEQKQGGVGSGKPGYQSLGLKHGPGVFAQFHQGSYGQDLKGEFDLFQGGGADLPFRNPQAAPEMTLAQITNSLPVFIPGEGTNGIHDSPPCENAKFCQL